MNIKPLSTIVAALALAALAGCQSQQTFQTPEAAVTALDQAAAAQNRAELQSIFGPDGSQLASGDPDQDYDDLARFSAALAAQHALQMDGPDAATILVGPDQWPFAVPLVRENGVWRFDTAAGIEEMTDRRIGRNELRTIEALDTLMDAQAEYKARNPDRAATPHFADRLMSSPGKKDGLYWEAIGGVDPSPIGPALASAAARTDASGARMPFYGYSYKLLRSQGAAAPGGAKDYMKNGQLVDGWAVLAWPADYDRTGVMSFMASANGVIYQKDLGQDTAKAAEAITSFDPGDGWQPVN